MSYDLQGRLVSQQLADALDNITDQRTYSYDKNSNILNIDTNTEDNSYVYDRLDRLTSDSIDDNNPFTYGYDLNDNRLSRQQGTGTEELDEWINLIDNSNRIAHIDTLQRNAILPDLPDREMVYNDVGRLYQLMEEGNLKSEYIYNDMGQRTRKTIYQSDGTTVDSVTIYHYNQMGMLVTETTETGVLMKDYVWNGGVIAAQITATDAGNTGNAGAVTSEAIIYLYTDHLMTNRLATDETQQVVWRWEGEAFGNTPAEELGGVSVNLRFPGQYFDAETNLHYNMFRYYDPQIGRYITSDPVGLIAGTNTYHYVAGNPIGFNDFSGLVSWNNRSTSWRSVNSTSGFTFSVYPGGSDYTSPSNVLGITLADWYISCACVCKGEKYVLDSCNVDFQPIVYIQHGYNNPRIGPWVVRAEMDHVNDLLNWALNAGHQAANLAEQSEKTKTYIDKVVCEISAEATIQSALQRSVHGAMVNSGNTHDKRGRHSFGGANARR